MMGDTASSRGPTTGSRSPMSAKIDFKRTLDAYQAPRGRFRIVDVPEMRYLMVDGHGDPGTSPAFTQAVEALYPVADELRSASRRDLGRDYVVPPLEGLWSADDVDTFTVADDEAPWDWTVMIMVPDWLDETRFAAAVDRAGGQDRPARLDDVRLAPFAEGRCVQTLHVGPFDEEEDVLGQMHHGFIPSNGLRTHGTHHEIYLSDVRRVEPAAQRTILRQPVATDTQAQTTL
jgi:hypothetical protein